MGQGADEVVAVGLVAGPDDLLPGGVGPAEGHVLGDGAAEEPGVLEDHGEAVPGGGPGIFGHVPAAQQNLTGIHVIEPHEQVDEGGLAGTGGTDDGDVLALLDPDGEIPDQGRVLRVGEVHMAELHGAVAAAWQFGGDGRFLRQIQDAHDPPGGGLGLLQGAEAVGDLLQRLGELPGVEHHGDDDADGDAVLHDQPAAHQIDGDVGQGVGRGDDRLNDGGEETGAALFRNLPLVDLGMAAGAVLFEVVGLGGVVVGVGLLDHGVELARLLEHPVEAGFGLARNDGGEPDGQGREHHDQNGQQPVFQQQHDCDRGDLQKAAHDRVDDLMEGVADVGDVVGHAGEDVAHRRVVHIADGEPLDLVRELDADGAGEVAADGLVEQQHFEIGDQAPGGVDGQQGQQTRQDNLGDGIARRLPDGEIVDQRLDETAHQLRGGDGAADQQDAQEAAQGQLPADAFGLLQKLQQGACGLPAFLGIDFFHGWPPPVWEA